MKSKTYTDDYYCDECDDDTLHVQYETGHERDSSGDWRICLKCGRRESGYSDYASKIDAEWLQSLQKEYVKDIKKFEGPQP